LYRKTYYPELKTQTYLNHAAVSPLSAQAQKAMQFLIQRYVEEGSKAWTEGFGYRTAARENIAKLISVDASSVGMTQNTSTGLMMVAQEFPWNKGDGLVLLEGEFPGNIVPWLVAARQHQLEVHWLRPEDIATGSARLLQVMQKKPRLMALSWVQYQTGFTLSLARLSQLRSDYPLQICLDGIQGIGALPMDLQETPLDYVVCGGHKWLLGPEGTGFIHIHPGRMGSMTPSMVSWLSQEDPISFLFKGPGWVDYDKAFRAEASRIEGASMSNVLFAGMAESTAIFHQVGKDQVSKRVLYLAEFAREGLRSRKIPFADNQSKAGIVSIPFTAEVLARHIKAFQEEDIAVGSPDGHLRIAPHFHNNEEDIERALYLLERLRT